MALGWSFQIKLAFKLASSCLRFHAGLGTLGLLLVGIWVGVTAMALLGSATDTLRTGAKQGALVTIGGDVSLRLFHTQPSPAQLDFFHHLVGPKNISLTREFRPVVHEVNGVNGASVLSEVKGVDLSYPLYGAVKTSPQRPLIDLLDVKNNTFGAVVDGQLLTTLGLSIGDELRIGLVVYEIRGQLDFEPDRAFRAFSLGPRVMVLSASLPATGLAADGAEIYTYTHLKMPPHLNPAQALSQINSAFPNAGWRMVNAHDGVPGLERTLAFAEVLLLIIGLGILLVGGSGIASAVSAYLRRKMKSIAILKSMGCAPRVVILSFGIQVMTVAAVGSILGVLTGALGSYLVVGSLADQVPFALSPVPALQPLIAAFLFGILTALFFAWGPLARVGRISAQVLLRPRKELDASRQSWRIWAGQTCIGFGLIGLVFWVSPFPVLNIVFLTVAFALALGYAGLGRLLGALAKRLAFGRGAGLRLAVSNLHRPGAPTGPLVMALGLTLTLLVALDGVGRMAVDHVGENLPNQAPDYVAFSLPPDQAMTLTNDLSAWDGTAHIFAKPFLHARVQSINGAAVDKVNVPRSLSWVVRGDRGVSFQSNTWWQNGDQPGISLDDNFAQKVGLKRGDTMTLNVAGQVVTAPIVHLRTVDWTGLELEFPIITTPITLHHIPHTFAASIKAKPGRAAEMETFIKTNFPDVALIRVGDVLGALQSGMESIISGLKIATLWCGLAALVVLVGSVLQSLNTRIDEVALFKILGASRRQIIGQLIAEFCVLGLAVALVAVPLGIAIAYGVARAAGLDSSAIILVDVSALFWAGSAIALTLVVGLSVTAKAYARPPSACLRNRAV